MNVPKHLKFQTPGLAGSVLMEDGDDAVVVRVRYHCYAAKHIDMSRFSDADAEEAMDILRQAARDCAVKALQGARDGAVEALASWEADPAARDPEAVN